MDKPCALTWFEWWGATPIGVWMHHSTWAFASIEIVHLIGIAALGGIVVVVELQSFGLLHTRAGADLGRQLAPWLSVNLAILVVSGALLVASAPLKYCYSTAFAVKLALLLTAASSYPLLHGPLLQTARRRVRHAAAWLSLLLWSSIGIAGRTIGLL